MNEEPSNRQNRDRALFDKFAETWCKKDLLPASRLARQHRLDQTLRAIPLPKFKHVLEIGCGAGFTASYLQGRFERYTGIDPSNGLIEYARRYNGGPNIEFHTESVQSYKPNVRFDLIIMIGVLHHIPDVLSVMPHVGRLLCDGGWLAANEPQSANPIISLARSVRKRLEKAYSDEQDQFSSDQLRAIFDAAKLRRVELMPQGIFSTPFAEIALSSHNLARLVAASTCKIDSMLETAPKALIRLISWNLIAIGCRQNSGSDVVTC